MTKCELFTMIFYVLDYYWDQNQEEELGNFLSDMSPFTFADIGLADPAVYSEFCLNGLPKKIGLINAKFIWSQTIKPVNNPTGKYRW